MVDSSRNALRHAFRLLGYKDRSENEMYERLIKKGFSGKVAEEVVAYLRDRGFIDDRRFAETLKKNAVDKKYLGKRGTRNYLMSKGIPSVIADEILGSEDDYLDAAKMLVEKKIRNMKNIDEDAIKRRLWGMLLRKGFSVDTVKKVVKSLDLKEEENEVI